MATVFTNFSFVKLSFNSNTAKKRMFTRPELLKRELGFTYFLRELSVLYEICKMKLEAKRIARLKWKGAENVQQSC
jgi:hypothetical protein